MKHNLRSLALAGACAALISGCAVGNKHQYAEAIPAIKVQAAKSLSVGVLDKRAAIVSKTKAEDFVGIQRGGFGNPFDVTTASGKPLAADMTAAVASGLRQDGAKTREVELASSLPETDAMRQVATAGSERGVLLTLNEWKADTMTNTALHYDVRLSVLDASGKLLTSSEMKGRDDLGGNFLNPPEHAKSAVPSAFKARMEALFAAPEVGAALR